jgi:hypothetical protein
MGEWQWGGISLEFTDDSNAVLGGAGYSYSYVNADKTGTINGVGAFSLASDNMTLTIANYKNWGSVVAFKKFKANELVGTYWRWGTSLVSFVSGDTLVYRTTEYSYIYNSAKKSGTIDILGDFAIEGETLTMLDYKYYGSTKYPALGTKVAVPFNRQDDNWAPDIDTTVLGTEWIDGPLGQWIIFINDEIIFQGSSSQVFLDPYTYNAPERRGWIYFLNDFIINESGTCITLVSFKNNNHAADFWRAR